MRRSTKRRRSSGPPAGRCTATRCSASLSPGSGGEISWTLEDNHLVIVRVGQPEEILEAIDLMNVIAVGQRDGVDGLECLPVEDDHLIALVVDGASGVEMLGIVGQAVEAAEGFRQDGAVVSLKDLAALEIDEEQAGEREDEQRERSRQDILDGLAARLGAGQTEAGE